MAATTITTPATPKKIVLVGPVYPYRGGNSLFTSYLYRELSRKFSVTVINYSLLYPSLLFPGTTQYDESGDIPFTIDSERLVNSINPFSWWIAAKRIKEIDPSLIVIDWWNPFFGPTHFGVLGLLGKKYRTRAVMTVHNVISHEQRVVDKLFTRLAFLYCSRFIVLSKAVQKQLQALVPQKKIFVSEHPVYDVYSPKNRLSENERRDLKAHFHLPENENVLLFFGYIRSYKGLDSLIKSLPIVHKSHPNTMLLIGGECYENPEKYQNLIESLRLKPYIRFDNRFIPNEEVYKYFVVADMVVLPYREATQSGVLTIAYDFQKPVVVSNSGSLADYVRDGKTGVVLKDCSPQGIAEGITRLITLHRTVDFSSEIADYISQNRFFQITELIEQFIHR